MSPRARLQEEIGKTIDLLTQLKIDLSDPDYNALLFFSTLDVQLRPMLSEIENVIAAE